MSRRLRRVFDLTPKTVSEAEELRERSESVGGTPIQECDKGENVCACGVVRSVTIRPRAGTPALEAELYDGSGRITLVWLGRRMIEGITPGRWLKVQGRLNLCNDEKTIFNPYYELKPVGDSAQ